ncbi:hypothetical protein KFU94_52195 [Chloroflexi bacterium TSY]|nr:hypothetical protein [Chloroflexi bacterium TSY]
MDFHKLNIDPSENIYIFHCPDEIELPFESVHVGYKYLLSFVQTKAQLDETISAVKNENRAVILLLAYPKGTSKDYESEINRDSIVSSIKEASGFKAPKLVSLDKNWSAFSFQFEP